jgi:hypothetical protein
MEVFCDSSNISRPLKERIIQSLNYNSNKTFISLDDKNQLFHELPTQIKIQVFYFYFPFFFLDNLKHYVEKSRPDVF